MKTPPSLVLHTWSVKNYLDGIPCDKNLKQLASNAFQTYYKFPLCFSAFLWNYEYTILHFISEEDEEANDMFYQFDDAVMNNTQIDDAILDYDDIPQLGDDDDVTSADAQDVVSDNVVLVKDETEEELARSIMKVKCVFDVFHSFSRSACTLQYSFECVTVYAVFFMWMD